MRTVVALLFAAGVFRTAQAETEWRITSVAVRDMDYLAVSNGAGYSIVVTNTGTGVERRCYRDGHHFLSILERGGVFALRPHPGVDLNGWGSTLYLQSFVGTSAVLRGAVITNCTAQPDRIEVGATGAVSRAEADEYGAWEVNLECRYDRLAKLVTATAFYTVNLDGLLDGLTGDLNLGRLASNYLDDVPLLDGTTNDTGDMVHAHVEVGSFVDTWDPSIRSRHYPIDKATNLLVDVMGAFNCVDTRTQGFHAIQAAYKPTVKWTFASRLADGLVSFGGFYDTGKSKDFTADNIGITPLVLKASLATQFQFDVSMQSSALAGDGFGVVADLAATGTTGAATAEVYYVEGILDPFRRYVGDLRDAGSVSYTGRVTVPFPPALPHPAAGFFRLEVWTNGVESLGKQASGEARRTEQQKTRHRSQTQR